MESLRSGHVIPAIIMYGVHSTNRVLTTVHFHTLFISNSETLVFLGFKLHKVLECENLALIPRVSSTSNLVKPNA